MPEVPTVATFNGRLATDLTREELLEAYTAACRELTMLRTQMIEDNRMEQFFEDARRRLARR